MRLVWEKKTLQLCWSIEQERVRPIMSMIVIRPRRVLHSSFGKKFWTQNPGIIFTALMLWRGLSLWTGSESPVVVVLSGSMEPGFHRGDILFLNMWREDKFDPGDVIVFQVEGRGIPIVHRRDFFQKLLLYATLHHILNCSLDKSNSRRPEHAHVAGGEPGAPDQGRQQSGGRPGPVQD